MTDPRENTGSFRLEELRNITNRIDALDDFLGQYDSSLRSLIDAIGDMILVMDSEGFFEHYFNKSEKVPPLAPPDEFLGKHYTAVLPIYLHGPTASALAKLQEKRDTQVIEYPLEMGEETRWFEARLSAIVKNDIVTGTVIVVRENTLQVQIEQERVSALATVEFERERLEQVLDGIGAGLAQISLGVGGQVLWANVVLRHIYPDIVGKQCSVACKSGKYCKDDCPASKVIKGAKRARLIVKNEASPWKEIIATPVLNREGKLTAVMELYLPKEPAHE